MDRKVAGGPVATAPLTLGWEHRTAALKWAALLSLGLPSAMVSSQLSCVTKTESDDAGRQEVGGCSSYQPSF